MRIASPPLLSTILEHEQQPTDVRTAAYPASTISSANVTDAFAASRHHVSLLMPNADSEQIDPLNLQRQQPHTAHLTENNNHSVSVATSLRMLPGAPPSITKPHSGSSAFDGHQAASHLASLAAQAQQVRASDTLMQSVQTAPDSDPLLAAPTTITEQRVGNTHVHTDAASTEPHPVDKPLQESATATEEKSISEGAGGTEGTTQTFMSSTVVRAIALESSSTPETISATTSATDSEARKELSQVEGEASTAVSRSHVGSEATPDVAAETTAESEAEETDEREADVGDTAEFRARPVVDETLGTMLPEKTANELLPADHFIDTEPALSAEKQERFESTADAETAGEMVEEGEREAVLEEVKSPGNAHGEIGDEESKQEISEELKVLEDSSSKDKTPTQPVVVGDEDDLTEHTTVQQPIQEFDAGMIDATEADTKDHSEECAENNESVQPEALSSYPSADREVEGGAHTEDTARTESAAVEQSPSVDVLETEDDVSGAELKAAEEATNKASGVTESAVVEESSSAVAVETADEVSARGELELVEEPNAAVDSEPAEKASEAIESTPVVANEADQSAETQSEDVEEQRAVVGSEPTDYPPTAAASEPVAEQHAAVQAEPKLKIFAPCESEHMGESSVVAEAKLVDDTFEGAESAYGQESSMLDEVVPTAPALVETGPEEAEEEGVLVDAEPVENPISGCQSGHTEESSTVAGGEPAEGSSGKVELVPTEISSAVGEAEPTVVASDETSVVDAQPAKESIAGVASEQVEEPSSVDEGEPTVGPSAKAEQVPGDESRAILETEQRAPDSSETEPELVEEERTTVEAQRAEESTARDESEYTDGPSTVVEPTEGPFAEAHFTPAKEAGVMPEAEQDAVVPADTLSGLIEDEHSVVHEPPAEEPITEPESRPVEKPSAVVEGEPTGGPVQAELGLAEEPLGVTEAEPTTADSAEIALIDGQPSEEPIAGSESEEVEEPSTVFEGGPAEGSRAAAESVHVEESTAPAEVEPTVVASAETQPELVMEDRGVIDSQPTEESAAGAESQRAEEPSTAIEREATEGAFVEAELVSVKEPTTVVEAAPAAAGSAETESELVEEQRVEAEAKPADEPIAAAEAIENLSRTYELKPIDEASAVGESTRVAGSYVLDESKEDAPVANESERVQGPAEVVQAEPSEADCAGDESKPGNETPTVSEFVEEGDVGDGEAEITTNTELNELPEAAELEDQADDESKPENETPIAPKFVEEGDVGDAEAGVTTAGGFTESPEAADLEDRVDDGKESDAEVAEVGDSEGAAVTDATRHKSNTGAHLECTPAMEVQKESLGEALGGSDVVGEAAVRHETANAIDFEQVDDRTMQSNMVSEIQLDRNDTVTPNTIEEVYPTEGAEPGVNTENVEVESPAGEVEGAVGQSADAITAEPEQVSQLQLNDREYELVQSITWDTVETSESEQVTDSVTRKEDVEGDTVLEDSAESHEPSSTAQALRSAAVEGNVVLGTDASEVAATESVGDETVEAGVIDRGEEVAAKEVTVTGDSLNAGDSHVGDTAGEHGAGIEADTRGMGDGETGVVDGTEKMDVSGDDALTGADRDTEEAVGGDIGAMDTERGHEKVTKE